MSAENYESLQDHEARIKELERKLEEQADRILSLEFKIRRRARD